METGDFVAHALRESGSGCSESDAADDSEGGEG